MKKVLSLALILSLGIAAFAQTRQMAPSAKAKMSPKIAVGNEKTTEVSPLENVIKGNALPSKAWHNESLYEFEVMINSFDLQSNSNIANRIAAWSDGSLATVATFMPGDKSPWTQAAQYRGTGYNHFGGDFDAGFDEQPESRIESSKTGWPSIAPFGPNGEIIVAHTGTGLVYMTRENRGQGEWSALTDIPNPEGHPTIDESASLELSWPRVATCGANHDIINIVCSTQTSVGSGDDAIAEYQAFLTRSTDGGQTWTTVPMPEMPNNALNQCAADDYAMAAKGNNIAVLFTSPYNGGGGEYHMTDICLYKSTDAGETWTREVVWQAPFEGNWFDPFVFDTINHDKIYMPAMGSVAIDNNGTAHVALTAEAVKCGDGGTTYSYYFGVSVDGVFYWKEGDEPFTTGPTFEDGYTDSYKALCPWDTYYRGNDTLTGYNERWISGTPVYTMGDGDDLQYVDYRTLLKASDEMTDEEWQQANFQALAKFTDDYDNHLYEGSATNYQVKNGNYARCMGAGNLCGWPSIAVDDNGLVAIAYSVPDFRREYNSGNNFLYRGIYVTYIDHGVIYPYADYLSEDFMHQVEEMVSVTALPYSYGSRQFVFGYMGDPEMGWAGTQPPTADDSDPADQNPGENTQYIAVVTPDAVIDEVKEAVNPMNNVSVRPNPASETLYIDINSNQRTDMTATVYNITGQKVMEQNLSSIAAGLNTRSINVSNLTSGVYFVTVKANGFEQTQKFIVK